MSACFYIVVPGEDPGFDIFVNGRALARHEADLESLAQSLGVRPLLDYFSADQNSMATLLEQGAGDPEWAETLPAPQWFSAEDGSRTAGALLAYLTAHPAAFGSDTFSITKELSEYHRVLEKTATRGLPWHLAVSWR